MHLELRANTFPSIKTFATHCTTHPRLIIFLISNIKIFLLWKMTTMDKIGVGGAILILVFKQVI